MDVFYFGCRDRDGHFLWRSTERVGFTDESLPWKKLDCKLTPGHDQRYPPDDQPEGLGLLHHKEGWTAWAFWDRTGDRRNNSNSIFIAKGTHTLEKMIELAADHYPNVWQRVRHLTFRLDQ